MMRINLKFNGMPLLYKAMSKKKEIEFDFPGETLRELTENLRQKYGPVVEKALLDRNSDIDMEIRVVLNNVTYLVENRMDTSLKNGDTLVFMGAS